MAMTSPPSAIYLQFYGVEDLKDVKFSGMPDGEEQTWSQEKIFETDVRYVIDKRYKRNRRSSRRNADGRSPQT